MSIDNIFPSDGGNDPREKALRQVLARFAQVDPQKAELVRLRYFDGLTLEEAALKLEIPELTARRWWIYARVWCYRQLTQSNGPDGPP